MATPLDNELVGGSESDGEIRFGELVNIHSEWKKEEEVGSFNWAHADASASRSRNVWRQASRLTLCSTKRASLTRSLARPLKRQPKLTPRRYFVPFKCILVKLGLGSRARRQMALKAPSQPTTAARFLNHRSPVRLMGRCESDGPPRSKPPPRVEIYSAFVVGEIAQEETRLHFTSRNLFHSSGSSSSS